MESERNFFCRTSYDNVIFPGGEKNRKYANVENSYIFNQKKNWNDRIVLYLIRTLFV